MLPGIVRRIGDWGSSRSATAGIAPRYRDPLGRQRRETFTRKADAERYLREVQVDIERGNWIDPAGADVAPASWSKEFLSLARRLSPSTQETYARDLRRYVLPRFGSYRIGRLPADERELAQRRDRRWHRSVVGTPPLPRTAAGAPGRGREGDNWRQPVRPGAAPSGAGAVFLTWEDAVDLAEAINQRYRALIYLAVDSGMRWSESSASGGATVDLNPGKVRVTAKLIRLESRRVATQGAEDSGRRPLSHDLAGDGDDPRRSRRAVHRARPRLARVPQPL